MSIELRIINPLNYPNWDNILLSNQQCNFFHSSIWAKVLNEVYKYQPVYFAQLNKDKLLTLFPVMEVKTFLTGRRGVSLPFSDYCEPIIDEHFQFQDSVNFILQYGQKIGWNYFELRGGDKFNQDILPYQHFFLHTLSLNQNIEQIFSNLRKSTQRNINKANREGVKINDEQSLDAIKEFYKLNCITRKHHGLPPQPYNFFKAIFNQIISKNNGFIILASYKKRIIAGAIFFHFVDEDTEALGKICCGISSC